MLRSSERPPTFQLHRVASPLSATQQHSPRPHCAQLRQPAAGRAPLKRTLSRPPLGACRRKAVFTVNRRGPHARSALRVPDQAPAGGVVGCGRLTSASKLLHSRSRERCRRRRTLWNLTAMPPAKCRTTRARLCPTVTGEPIGGAIATFIAAPSLETSINVATCSSPSGVVTVIWPHSVSTRSCPRLSGAPNTSR